jgi:hypothetical protein
MQIASPESQIFSKMSVLTEEHVLASFFRPCEMKQSRKGRAACEKILVEHRESSLQSLAVVDAPVAEVWLVESIDEDSDTYAEVRTMERSGDEKRRDAGEEDETRDADARDDGVPCLRTE